MVGQRDWLSEASIFARASKACYAVALFAVIMFGWWFALSALGLLTVPSNLLPAFSVPSGALLLLVAVFGFYMHDLGRVFALRFLRMSSILIVASSLALFVVFSPALVGFSLSFYETLPTLFASLFTLVILSIPVIFIVALSLFCKGVKDMGAKLYLRGLRVFRKCESVFLMMVVAYVLLGVVLLPLMFSSSPVVVELGSQLWGDVGSAIFGIGGIVLLILFGATLGKLGDPKILARAVEAAALFPPEPRLFGLPAKWGERHEWPSSVRESLRGIEWDKKFEFSILGQKYLELKRRDIFMLVPKVWGGPYIAYFIKLFNQTPTNSKRFKAPLVLPRKKHFSQSVAGFPVAKFRGKFTLPVDMITKTEGSELRYASGSGIMYLVPRWDPSRGMYPPRAMFSREDLSEKFDKTVILGIIEKLSKETLKTGARI